VHDDEFLFECNTSSCVESDRTQWRDAVVNWIGRRVGREGLDTGWSWYVVTRTHVRSLYE